MRRHLRGLERDASRKPGPGSRAGRRAARVSALCRRSGSSPSRRGWSDGVGSGGPEGTASRSSTPRGRPPRRGSNFVTKSETSPISLEGTATGGRRPGGQRPGRLVRANFGRLVGTSGRVAGAWRASPLALGRRLCLGFDVCESSGRPRRRAADSCVL